MIKAIVNRLSSINTSGIQAISYFLLKIELKNNKFCKLQTKKEFVY